MVVEVAYTIADGRLQVDLHASWHVFGRVHFSKVHVKLERGVRFFGKRFRLRRDTHPFKLEWIVALIFLRHLMGKIGSSKYVTYSVRVQPMLSQKFRPKCFPDLIARLPRRCSDISV